MKNKQAAINLFNQKKGKNQKGLLYRMMKWIFENDEKTFTVKEMMVILECYDRVSISSAVRNGRTIYGLIYETERIGVNSFRYKVVDFKEPVVKSKKGESKKHNTNELWKLALFI